MARAKLEQVVVEMETVTEHVNEDGQIICCDRCHKKVTQMGTFFRWRGLVVGPECIVKAQEVGKGVKGYDKLLAAIRAQYLVAKREDTIRGMKAKGML